MSRTGQAIALAALLVLLGLAAAGCGLPPPPPIAALPPPTATSIPLRPSPTPTLPAPIKIGGLFDLTGPTAHLSAPYVDAIRTYVRQANEQGGVNGRQVQLVEADYAYDLPRAVDAYKRLVAQDKVVAILGWFTPDTEGLSPLLAQDKSPFLSASYAESLVENAAARPYNFLIGATYSSQMRLLLRYVKDNWRDPARSPGVALLFSADPFGRSPLSAARGEAGQLDIKIVDEQALAEDAEEAISVLSSSRSKGADFVIVNNLPAAAAVAARDAVKMGFAAQLMALNWSVDEDVLERAGRAAEGMIGVSSFAMPAQGGPGIAEMRAAYSARGAAPSALTVRHVQGWLVAKLVLEGIRRAGATVTGEAIKTQLETITAYDTGGITAPITWSKDSHAGNNNVKLYQVYAGQWVALTDFVPTPR